MKIGLLSCTKKKMDCICPVEEMYSKSAVFRHSLEYANMVCDEVFVLSAKHGLLSLDDIIRPYDETLVKKPVSERREWAKKIISELKRKTDLENDEFIILAGQKYSEFLLDSLKNHYLPLQGVSLHGRISKLKELIKNTDDRAVLIHDMIRKMPQYTWDTIGNLEFENGIYIIFEPKNSDGASNRIVRIGTHTGPDRLKGRIRGHYISNRKDGSVFRKDIGLAMLNKERDEYSDIWNLNTSNPQIKKENEDRLNPDFEKMLEERVSDYLREKTKFVCIEVNDLDERLRIEEGLIAILGGNKNFKPDDDWLGYYHPDSRIRKNFIWNKQGLDGKPLSLDEVRNLVRGQTGEK